MFRVIVFTLFLILGTSSAFAENLAPEKSPSKSVLESLQVELIKSKAMEERGQQELPTSLLSLEKEEAISAVETPIVVPQS